MSTYHLSRFADYIVLFSSQFTEGTFDTYPEPALEDAAFLESLSLFCFPQGVPWVSSSSSSSSSTAVAAEAAADSKKERVQTPTTVQEVRDRLHPSPSRVKDPAAEANGDSSSSSSKDHSTVHHALHFFVSTDELGAHRFGVCLLQTHPTGQWDALAILSRFPFFETFARLAKTIFPIWTANPAQFDDRCFHLVFMTPLPAPGGMSIEFSIERELFVVGRPLHRQVVDVDFCVLLGQLSPSNILLVYASLLLERSVLFHSSSLYVLGTVCECFYQLLFPFKWEQVYIPVLPSALLGVLQSPAPFLVGTHSSNIQECIDELDEGIVLVDLDCDIVANPMKLPSALHLHFLQHLRSANVLRLSLQHFREGGPQSLASEEYKLVNYAVLSLFSDFAWKLASSICSFFKPDTQELDVQAFCLDNPQLDMPFLEEFSETSLYHQFLDNEKLKRLVKTQSEPPSWRSSRKSLAFLLPSLLTSPESALAEISGNRFLHLSSPSVPVFLWKPYEFLVEYITAAIRSLLHGNVAPTTPARAPASRADANSKRDASRDGKQGEPEPQPQPQAQSTTAPDETAELELQQDLLDLVWMRATTLFQMQLVKCALHDFLFLRGRLEAYVAELPAEPASDTSAPLGTAQRKHRVAMLAEVKECIQFLASRLPDKEHSQSWTHLQAIVDAADLTSVESQAVCEGLLSHPWCDHSARAKQRRMLKKADALKGSSDTDEAPTTSSNSSNSSNSVDSGSATSSKVDDADDIQKAKREKPKLKKGVSVMHLAAAADLAMRRTSVAISAANPKQNEQILQQLVGHANTPSVTLRRFAVKQQASVRHHSTPRQARIARAETIAEERPSLDSQSSTATTSAGSLTSSRTGSMVPADVSETSPKPEALFSADSNSAGTYSSLGGQYGGAHQVLVLNSGDRRETGFYTASSILSPSSAKMSPSSAPATTASVPASALASADTESPVENIAASPLELSIRMMEILCELFRVISLPTADMFSANDTHRLAVIASTSAFQSFGYLAEHLSKVSLRGSFASMEEKLCFYLNVRNALVLHSVLELGGPTSRYQWQFLNSIARYNVAGKLFSVKDIDETIFKFPAVGVEKSLAKYVLDSDDSSVSSSAASSVQSQSSDTELKQPSQGTIASRRKSSATRHQLFVQSAATLDSIESRRSSLQQKFPLQPESAPKGVSERRSLLINALAPSGSIDEDAKRPSAESGGVSESLNLVSFACFNATAAGPYVQVYRPDIVWQQLRCAAVTYCNQQITVVASKVSLPCHFRWYYSDFGTTKSDIINWIARLPECQAAVTLSAYTADARAKLNVEIRKPLWQFAVTWLDAESSKIMKKSVITYQIMIVTSGDTTLNLSQNTLQLQFIGSDEDASPYMTMKTVVGSNGTAGGEQPDEDTVLSGKAPSVFQIEAPNISLLSKLRIRILPSGSKAPEQLPSLAPDSQALQTPWSRGSHGNASIVSKMESITTLLSGLSKPYMALPTPSREMEASSFCWLPTRIIVRPCVAKEPFKLFLNSRLMDEATSEIVLSRSFVYEISFETAAENSVSLSLSAEICGTEGTTSIRKLTHGSGTHKFAPGVSPGFKVVSNSDIGRIGLLRLHVDDFSFFSTRRWSLKSIRLSDALANTVYVSATTDMSVNVESERWIEFPLVVATLSKE